MPNAIDDDGNEMKMDQCKLVLGIIPLQSQLQWINELHEHVHQALIYYSLESSADVE